MKKNAFELFRCGKLPHQKEIENWAAKNKNITIAEYYFRAGFLARQFTSHEGWIMVRKEDLTLDWYKETKARLQEEEI